MKTNNNNNETKAAGLVNEYYTIFVSKTGKHDHTAFLWVETKDAETYRRALADVELRGYKVSKIYKPTDVVTAPDFTKCVNTPAEKMAPAKNMKLSPVFEQAAEKVRAFVNKYGEAKVKAYMQQVYDAHEWQNYEVRISNDIVKYYAVGVATVGEWIDKYNANDSHVTTLCVAVMKAVGLLPFNPEKPADAAPADECDEVKKWAAESVAEVYDDGEFNNAVNEYGDTLHNKVTGEILKAPATAPTRPGYKANARVKNMAVSFANNGGEVKKVTRRGVELYEVHRPTGTQILLLTAEDFAETFSPKADKPTSPAEVKKIAKDEKATKARKYAEKLSNAPAETLAGLFGNSDRVAILANAYDLTDNEARELLADVQKAPTSDEKGDTGTTTPADECEAVTSEEKAPEGESLTPEAVAVVEKIQKSPRRVCLFDTFAELYEVKTKAEADGLHKWQALNACGVYREGRDTLATIARMITGDDEAEAPAPSCYSQSEKLGESGSQKSPLYSVAEKVGKVAHAAFFLLSLTIGTSHEAAEIVTNDPAAVFAQVAEAGETLTAFALEEIPTPDELPAADVPALL